MLPQSIKRLVALLLAMGRKKRECEGRKEMICHRKKTNLFNTQVVIDGGRQIMSEQQFVISIKLKCKKMLSHQNYYKQHELILHTLFILQQIQLLKYTFKYQA
ncbi:hypothetical protein TTHERM_000317059 (macronuclear) [Tetrahymena thermophila SB210]|uniref:Uncharacterized protein n=1 Tax=Tetrahymena thermophila (strain SB210) TaxID=312017 RepID=W7X9K5_TETTS|nr:hypothetical protein TTHERM_000317059 [Tetrahymena thermophila SB210]EWS73083.1 hypothetical protein TTHERM_000317059 [Tetrahymena thermophila SB210]|eukprot:XP_012654392.1 hypothetical protein TTHERM_000317059 [Tetrahymena thermophila SB210]